MKSRLLLTSIFALSLTPAFGQESAHIYAWAKAVCTDKTNYCDVIPGGSIIVPLPSVRGFNVYGRLEISGQVGQKSVELSDPKTWNTGEAYIGINSNSRPYGNYQISLAAAYGQTFALSKDAVLAVDKPRTYGGGIKLVGSDGFYAYLLYGKHESAGPGNRFIVTAFIPISGTSGWGIHLDGVTGNSHGERFVRFGIAIPVRLWDKKTPKVDNDDIDAEPIKED